jgi:hypothetical protein
MRGTAQFRNICTADVADIALSGCPLGNGCVNDPASLLALRGHPCLFGVKTALQPRAERHCLAQPGNVVLARRGELGDGVGITHRLRACRCNRCGNKQRTHNYLPDHVTLLAAAWRLKACRLLLLDDRKPLPKPNMNRSERRAEIVSEMSAPSKKAAGSYHFASGKSHV